MVDVDGDPGGHQAIQCPFIPRMAGRSNTQKPGKVYPLISMAMVMIVWGTEDTDDFHPFDRCMPLNVPLPANGEVFEGESCWPVYYILKARLCASTSQIPRGPKPFEMGNPCRFSRSIAFFILVNFFSCYKKYDLGKGKGWEMCIDRGKKICLRTPS